MFSVRCDSKITVRNLLLHGKGRKMNRKNESLTAVLRTDKVKDLLKKLKHFKEDNDKKIKVAVAVTVIAAAVLFFGLKGESQNSSLEDELLALSEGSASEGGNSLEKELEESLPVIYVDISGAVEKPGVYDVKEGTRVFEVIEMAGGLTSEADIDGFNRAEEVFDGQKLTIPEKISEEDAYVPGALYVKFADNVVNYAKSARRECSTSVLFPVKADVAQYGLKPMAYSMHMFDNEFLDNVFRLVFFWQY